MHGLQLATLLALLAFALAWPVPALLDRARWTIRSPGIALVLWQAIALAGGLAMLGSLVLFGLLPFGETLFVSTSAAIAWFWGGGALTGEWPDGFGLQHAGSLFLAAVLLVHLLLNLAVTTVRTLQANHRHRQLIELLSSPVPGQHETRVVAGDAPFAYCLPGFTQDLTVVSEGLLRRLDEQQLRAVVEHERAHLEQRHTIVLTLFAAWAAALPWFPIASRAQRSVELLIELLADDLACRHVPPRAVAEAIAVVATASVSGTSPIHDGVGDGFAEMRAAPQTRSSSRDDAASGQRPEVADAKVLGLSLRNSAALGQRPPAADPQATGVSYRDDAPREPLPPVVDQGAARHGAAVPAPRRGNRLAAAVGSWWDGRSAEGVAEERVRRLLSARRPLPVLGRLGVLTVAGLLLCLPPLAMI